ATALPELIEDRRALGTAEVEAIGDARGPGAGARDVARRFRHHGLAPFVRVEAHVAAVAVHAHREPKLRVPHANDAGVAAPRPEHRARLDGGIVLLVHPALRRNGRVI